MGWQKDAHADWTSCGDQFRPVQLGQFTHCHRIHGQDGEALGHRQWSALYFLLTLSSCHVPSVLYNTADWVPGKASSLSKTPFHWFLSLEYRTFRPH